jgi:hypothetical protein
MEEEEKSLQRREKGWKEKRERVAVAAWWPVGEEFKQPLVVETVMK